MEVLSLVPFLLWVAWMLARIAGDLREIKDKLP